MASEKTGELKTRSSVGPTRKKDGSRAPISARRCARGGACGARVGIMEQLGQCPAGERADSKADDQVGRVVLFGDDAAEAVHDCNARHDAARDRVTSPPIKRQV